MTTLTTPFLLRFNVATGLLPVIIALIIIVIARVQNPPPRSNGSHSPCGRLPALHRSRLPSQPPRLRIPTALPHSRLHHPPFRRRESRKKLLSRPDGPFQPAPDRPPRSATVLSRTGHIPPKLAGPLAVMRPFSALTAAEKYQLKTAAVPTAARALYKASVSQSFLTYVLVKRRLMWYTRVIPAGASNKNGGDYHAQNQQRGSAHCAGAGRSAAFTFEPKTLARLSADGEPFILPATGGIMTYNAKIGDTLLRLGGRPLRARRHHPQQRRRRQTLPDSSLSCIGNVAIVRSGDAAQGSARLCHRQARRLRTSPLLF